MKLTRSFETNRDSTYYIWSAFIEGEELCYKLSVDEYSHNKPPIRHLEADARRAVMRAIENKLFGEFK